MLRGKSLDRQSHEGIDMSTAHFISASILIGIGATLVMDLWLFGLKRLGVPTLNFAMVGRWAGHLCRGTLHHEAIAKARPVAGEVAWGWAVHYGVGIVFAGCLLMLAGEGWLTAQALWPALAVGLGSVVAPLCILQPAMGAGLASSKTPAPLRNCLRSLVTHGVFGLGLYAAGVVFSVLVP
jgi:hypothetical protein